MADQCIVCLENLDVHPDVALQLPQGDLQDGSLSASAAPPQSVPEAASTPSQSEPQLQTTEDVLATAATENDEDSKIAEIDVCGHVLHDGCLREWTGKANSCPICRQSFHLVNVYDKVGGSKLSSYTVQDKKQVAEFDAQTWLDQNPEPEEPATPCPICEHADHEEVLLLCDNCDASYHTYCVGLDSVPRGHWFCMECADDAEPLLAELGDIDEASSFGSAGASSLRNDFLPRTRATMRRARRRARSDEWQGAWGQITGQVFDALNIDLDNHDDDEALQNYRRSQRRRERDRREYQRWQQRLSIASRLGARDVFANHLPRAVAQRAPTPPPPPPVQETPEEKEAWGALDKAMEVTTAPAGPSTNGATSSRRKRKSRSVTTSPREPPPQEERRFKRPRTKRVPQSSEAASSSSQNGESSTAQAARLAAQTTPVAGAAPPSFLSSLLKEVEMSTASDEENVRAFGNMPRPTAASSPATSPMPSGYSSPRALSTTPPPRNIMSRPGSPLSLASHIEPIYRATNVSPVRNGEGSGSDSESRAHRRQQQNGAMRQLEIRHPQPRRQHSPTLNTNQPPHSPESSPTRTSLTLETKEGISAIITAALKPHYKSGKITADQYTAINRDLSRKLYKEVPKETLDGEIRQRCEIMATKEVAKAVSDLKEIKV